MANLFYQQLQEQSDGEWVKVVRCKDCEHWGLHRTWLKGNEVYMQDCFINEMMTKPDFFCAGGEKKGRTIEVQVDELAKRLGDILREVECSIVALDEIRKDAEKDGETDRC